MQLEEILEFCNKEKLNVNQFVFLYCEYFNKQDLYTSYVKINGYEGKILPDVMIRDLLEKAFIKQIGNNLFITDKFINLYKDYRELGNELFDLYPSFALNINSGTSMPLKGVDKYELSVKYYKSIKKSKKEHDEVLKDLKYAIDNNLINFKIDKFVLGEMWKDFRKLRLGNSTQQFINRDF